MSRITVGCTCGSRILHAWWLNTWAKHSARKFSTRPKVHEVVLIVGFSSLCVEAVRILDVRR
jgi:hypothetical protein